VQTPDDPASDDLTRPEPLVGDWQSVPESTDEWEPGQQLGPFRLRRQLGRGGMGMVWLADQLEPLRREVAIKVLPPGTRSRLAEAYFEVERQSLAQLSHHSIAQIYDAGRLPDGGLFFAMEYVRALPLDEFLSRNSLDFAALAQLLIDICTGVQHAHQRGLIHRDLKPGNILVHDDDGEVQPKIIDFGIAISTDGSAETERTRYSRAGTVAYMAPEQRNRDAGGIDVRTDVYALGAVLAEALLILAGEGAATERGFVSTTVRDGLLRSLPSGGRDHVPAATMDPTASLDPDQLNKLPVELRAIAACAMAEDPDQRYPSAAAMAEDLRRWLDAEPVEALEAGRMYRLRCFLRRNALATSAAAVVGVSLIVGVVLALYGLGEAREGRSQAEQARQLAENRRDDAEQLIEFMLGDFANGLRTIGRLDLLDGIGAEALRYLTEAGPSDDAPSALNRARALRTLGEVHVRRGQYDEAERALAQAAPLLEPWIEDVNPALADLQFESGQIAYWRGLAAYRQRDWNMAEIQWQRYLENTQRFERAGGDPTDARWELAYAWNNLGTLAEARNRPREALGHFMQTERYRREVMVARSDVTVLLGLANSLSWIGRVQGSLGETLRAWSSAEEALDLVINARLEAPDDARLRQAEVNFRLNLARLAVRIGFNELSRRQLRDALPQARADVANDPTQPRRQAALAVVAFMLAGLPDASPELAEEYFAQGKIAFRAAMELGIDDHQAIEIPALEKLAGMRLEPNPIQARSAEHILDQILDYLAGLDQADTSYMVQLETASRIIDTLNQHGYPPSPNHLEEMRDRTAKVPVVRRNDLRYYHAKAATGDGDAPLEPLLAGIRDQIRTGIDR